MAVLTDEKRIEVYQRLMQEESSARTPINLDDKADLRTLVNETDDWMDDSKASYLAALSEPGKSNLTGKQIVRVFCLIATERWGVE